MPNDELAYLAGVFDGEGSFGIWSKGVGKTKQLRVNVDMSDGDIVLRFLLFLKPEKSIPGNHKTLTIN